MANPTITKEEFEALSFKQTSHVPDKETGGTWSVRYVKVLNNEHTDYLEIFWTCCNNRYQIMRQTESIKNIFQYNGFLNNVKDLQYIMPLFDLRRFYEGVPSL